MPTRCPTPPLQPPASEDVSTGCGGQVIAWTCTWYGWVNPLQVNRGPRRVDETPSEYLDPSSAVPWAVISPEGRFRHHLSPHRDGRAASMRVTGRPARQVRILRGPAHPSPSSSEAPLGCPGDSTRTRVSFVTSELPPEATPKINSGRASSLTEGAPPPARATRRSATAANGT